jgi:beta-glucosidase
MLQVIHYLPLISGDNAMNNPVILPFRNVDLNIDDRASDLLGRLTIDEKLSMLNHEWDGIDRLGIPSYNWSNECLHGVARAGTATVFPQAIGMAASWNVDLMHQVADAISDEARAKHHESVRMGDRSTYKGLTFFSPNINLFRDPRWGRGHETYGEDPYLTGRMAVAFITGLQGNDPKYLKIAATAKHYAVHSGPESQRMTFDVAPSKRDLYETYLPAFHAAVVEGKVESVMSAYNRLYGKPCCASKFLLQDILRDEWGFDGYVVSDGGAYDYCHDTHMVSRGPAETTAMSCINGCDIELGNVVDTGAKLALEQGLITAVDIDTVLMRTIKALMKLGFYDPNEIVPYAAIPYDVVGCKKHMDLSLEMARQSMVLVKNNGILPLSNETKNIAVMGPNADSRSVLIGNYNGIPSKQITALTGIQQTAGDARVWFTQGCDLTDKPIFFAFGAKDRNLSEAVAAAKRSDVAILCMGLDPTMEGENGDPEAGVTDLGGDRKGLELPICQQELIKTIHDTGTPVVLVLFGGSPVAAPWAFENVAAVVQAFYPGELGGQAIADVLFGKVNPAGRMPITMLKSSEQLLPMADYNMAGHTYRFLTDTPSYYFGHGLSYTTFKYSNLIVGHELLSQAQTQIIEVDVTNIGKLDGDEVVQLYVKDVASSVPVPIIHLEGFQKIHLKSGETKRLEFILHPEQLFVYNDEGQPFFESGEYQIWVGGGHPNDPDAVVLKGMFSLDTFTV